MQYRLKRALRPDTISEQERARQVAAARQQIGRFLEQVLKFNADRRPTRRLEDLWVSNRCES